MWAGHSLTSQSVITTMHNEHDGGRAWIRRDFFRTAGAGVTAAAMMLTPREAALAQEAAQKAALDRIAANTYPIRPLFKQRPFGGRRARPGDSAGNPAARPRAPDRAATAPRIRRCSRRTRTPAAARSRHRGHRGAREPAERRSR